MNKFLTGFVIGALVGSAGTYVSTVRAGGRSSHDAAALQGLDAFLDAQAFDVGYYARNIKTGRTLERAADRPVCLASMVKVFCLTELYRRKVDEGLDLAQEIAVPPHGVITLAKAASLMIGISDNPCTHALADLLGRDAVNRIPALLGVDAMSANILPTETALHAMLDERIAGGQLAGAEMPMHGTARGMARYYELLLAGQVISREVSDELLRFFEKHPMPYSVNYNDTYNFGGKGGNILWTRAPKHFSCMGWGIFGRDAVGDAMVLCLWGEWFPQNMPPDRQSEFLKQVTDALVHTLSAL